MSQTPAGATQRAPAHPLGDTSRRRRLVKVMLWLIGVALAIAVLELLGVDVTGWFSQLWDQTKSVPVE